MNALDSPVVVRVAHRRVVASHVVELVLEPVGGRAVPTWAAGAHVDLELASGLVRQYSLCGAPGSADSLRIAVLLEVDGRGGSSQLHDRVRTGDLLTLAEVRNTFALDPAKPAMLVAGGIGITPLLSMAHELEERGAAWELYYGGRSLAAMAYRDELAQFADRVHLYPQDGRGLLPIDLVVEQARASSATIYACGPPAMLAAVQQRVAEVGDVELVLEQFGPPATGGSGGAFRVTAARSGLTFDIGPDEALLDVLEDQGLDVMSSCRSGICGTCEVAVLGGTPDHRDAFLTAEEREAGLSILPCVSRAASSHLHLDL